MYTSLASDCTDRGVGSAARPRAETQQQHFFLELVQLLCCLRLPQGALKEGDKRMMVKHKFSVLTMGFLVGAISWSDREWSPQWWQWAPCGHVKTYLQWAWVKPKTQLVKYFVCSSNHWWMPQEKGANFFKLFDLPSGYLVSLMVVLVFFFFWWLPDLPSCSCKLLSSKHSFTMNYSGLWPVGFFFCGMDILLSLFRIWSLLSFSEGQVGFWWGRKGGIVAYWNIQPSYSHAFAIGWYPGSRQSSFFTEQWAFLSPFYALWSCVVFVCLFSWELRGWSYPGTSSFLAFQIFEILNPPVILYYLNHQK